MAGQDSFWKLKAFSCLFQLLGATHTPWLMASSSIYHQQWQVQPSSPPPSSMFTGSYGSIGPTWVPQASLLTVRSAD